MKRMPALQSCALTFLVSSTAVLLCISAIVGMVCLGRWLPGVAQQSWELLALLLQVLATFGNGHSVQGSLFIAAACGGAIGLFDLLTPYRYEHLS
ncbi:MAG: hypothetical protein F6J87_07200 [Spirulina sp. SIO3F2]|nr:hypothetical protein [Spirulina sp. SIO3F2]